MSSAREVLVYMLPSPNFYQSKHAGSKPRSPQLPALVSKSEVSIVLNFAAFRYWLAGSQCRLHERTKYRGGNGYIVVYSYLRDHRNAKSKEGAYRAC